MNKLSNAIREYPFFIFTILVALISIFFFIYLPFQINLYPESQIKKVYYVDNISDAHLKIIRSFNEKFKNEIEVVPVNLPFYYFTTNDRKAVLTRSLRTRSDGIDIFAVDLIWIPRFAKWSFNLSNRFGEKTLASVNNMALKACFQNDSLVAFPLFLDLGVMYYRKDLIYKLPDHIAIEKKIQNSLTWEEFFDLGKRFRIMNNPFYVFTGGDFEGMQCCFHEMLSDSESNDIFYRKPINLNKPAAKRALQTMVDLIHRYNFSPTDVSWFDEYNSYIYANSRNAVFLRGWIGFHKQYKGFLTDTSSISKTEIAPLPHFKGNKTSSVFGGWSLMISKFSTRKEEALKFINYMFLKENQEILYENGGYLPINSEVYSDSLFLRKHKELVRIQKLLEWGKHRPSLENYTSISEIMSRSFHKALVKDISVTEALLQATKQINSVKTIEK